MALPLPWPLTHTFIPALHGNRGDGGEAGNFQIHKDTKKITYTTGPAKIIIITINK